MHLRTAKRLAEKYFKKCEEIYGYSKFYETTPYLDFEKSIYSRYSGINAYDTACEEDDTPEAEYDFIHNVIVIYYRNIKDAKHLAQTIIHEYQHYLQSPTWMTRYYNMGHCYSDHPYEIAAYKEEENYKMIIE